MQPDRPNGANAFDVVVVGSGASGLAAAVTAAAHGLRVVVIEKDSTFGGTTARSGGWLWVPGTTLATEQGIVEPPGAALEYLRSECPGQLNEQRACVFLENGPRAIEFFRRETCVQFDMPMFPDYHAELPGGQSTGGRSMVTRPFDGRELGEHLRQLGAPLPELTIFGMMLGSGREVWHFYRAFKSVESFLYVMKRFARHFRDVLLHGRGLTLTNGNALAGRLAKAALDKGAGIWLSTPMTGLVRRDGRVVGVRALRDGREIEIQATYGVVLASGGVGHDADRQRALYPHSKKGAAHHSLAPAANTGDGLRAAEAVGGRLMVNVQNAAAWTPISLKRRSDGSLGIMPHFIDRAKPGIIAISPSGVRFVDESTDYHRFVQAMLARCEPEGKLSAWLICDQKTLNTYGMGMVRPKPFSEAAFVASGYLKRGASLEALAEAIGVPAATLSETVRSYNADVRRGNDAAFGKGTTAYGRYMGDSLQTPNPCLAPVESAPFYAIELHIGDIGSFAGLDVDAACRVIGADMQPVRGLYAVGNDSVSVMGGSYPGAGITLGPALTFGYTAGLALAADRVA